MTGTISSEKIDLLVYGPIRPILVNGFPDQFVLHTAETTADLERLTPDTVAKIRGMAVTYHTVRADKTALSKFPKLEIASSFGVGYDHVDSAYARDHNIVVTNTPDVLTEEVADVAMGLLIATLREFIKADRYLRSGLWQSQNYPLSVGSLRDRKVGIVGMGRIGQAIGRRLEASRVPVFYHSRKPAEGVAYQHYPDLIEMAKAVDTLIVIVPGGASTAKMINADVLKALGPRGRLDQRRARLRGRRTGLDRGAEIRGHSGGRTGRVRGRAERAGRTEGHAECGAAATYWLGFGGNAQRHGPTRGRQFEKLVRRETAVDAGCGNSCKGPLMQSRRPDIALAALMLLFAGLSPATAQDASTLKKDMIGQWELATTERSKTCVVTLKGDLGPQGLKLELEPGCAAALPFTKEITAWNIRGLDIVRLQNAAGEAVIDFTEVESGIFEGLRTGEGVYILQNLAAARSLAKSMDQMIGDWSMVRGNGQTICGLTLTNTEAGQDNFQVFLKPKCDPAIAAFGPTLWRLDHGQMLLMSAKGETWQFEADDNAQWRRVPDSADPLMMLRGQ